MLRIAASVCIVILFSGCDKNWRGLHIEKRVYRDGYYVHLPWKRYTPKNEYPKPEPYPVDHSRIATTDTTQKFTGGVSSDSARTQPAVARTGSTNGSGTGSVASPSLNSGPAPQAVTAAVAVTVATPPPSAVAYSPPPQLEPVAIEDPMWSRVVPPDSTISPGSTMPPDSAFAASDSTFLPDDSIADKGGFDFPEGEFSFVAELGLYNSVAEKTYEVKPQSYNAGAGIRYSIHPWSRHKISAEASGFISNISVRQDQHKSSPLFTEPHGKERIMQCKMRFIIMDHIYITRNGSAKIDAIEFGLFSDAGVFSAHVAVDYHGNDDKAALTRSKTRLFGLKYIRTMQYGCTIRIANELWSVFANYRFNSLLKASSDGEDLPKLVVGVSRTFSTQ